MYSMNVHPSSSMRLTPSTSTTYSPLQPHYSAVPQPAALETVSAAESPAGCCTNDPASSVLCQKMTLTLPHRPRRKSPAPPSHFFNAVMASSPPTLRPSPDAAAFRASSRSESSSSGATTTTTPWADAGGSAVHHLYEVYAVSEDETQETADQESSDPDAPADGRMSRQGSPAPPPPAVERSGVCHAAELPPHARDSMQQAPVRSQGNAGIVPSSVISCETTWSGPSCEPSKSSLMAKGGLLPSFLPVSLAASRSTANTFPTAKVERVAASSTPSDTQPTEIQPRTMNSLPGFAGDRYASQSDAAALPFSSRRAHTAVPSALSALLQLQTFPNAQATQAKFSFTPLSEARSATREPTICSKVSPPRRSRGGDLHAVIRRPSAPSLSSSAVSCDSRAKVNSSAVTAAGDSGFTPRNVPPTLTTLGGRPSLCAEALDKQQDPVEDEESKELAQRMNEELAEEDFPFYEFQEEPADAAPSTRAGHCLPLTGAARVLFPVNDSTHKSGLPRDDSSHRRRLTSSGWGVVKRGKGKSHSDGSHNSKLSCIHGCREFVRGERLPSLAQCPAREFCLQRFFSRIKKSVSAVQVLSVSSRGGCSSHSSVCRQLEWCTAQQLRRACLQAVTLKLQPHSSAGMGGPTGWDGSDGVNSPLAAHRFAHFVQCLSLKNCSAATGVWAAHQVETVGDPVEQQRGTATEGKLVKGGHLKSRDILHMKILYYLQMQLEE